LRSRRDEDIEGGSLLHGNLGLRVLARERPLTGHARHGAARHTYYNRRVVRQCKASADHQCGCSTAFTKRWKKNVFTAPERRHRPSNPQPANPA
jgi:hypothetical protein